MSEPSPCEPLLEVSCSVCEKLHVPAAPQASNPVCGACSQERLPAARLPAWLPYRRQRFVR